MKTIFKFLVLFLYSLILTSCEEDNNNICDPSLQFNIDLFIQNLNTNLQSSSIAGYQFAVNKNGNLYHSEAFGFARHENDPGGEIEMTADTRQNVASVSKVIGTIALMNALEDNLLGQNINIQDNVVQYLPESWRPLVHPDFTDISSAAYLTFAKLLTNNTAINFLGDGPPASGLMLSEEDMLISLQQEPALDRIGEYQNANFTLIRVLIGELIYNLNENSIQYFIDCSELYFTYLRETIFDPLNINAPLTILDVESYYDNTNYPLAYQWPFDPNFQAPNDGSLGWQHTGNVLNPGSSGLLLSAKDLAKVFAFFRHDNQGTIISEAQRNTVLDLRLGFTTTQENQLYGTYYAKNGAKSNDCDGCGRSLRSAVVLFPNDIEVILLTNYSLRNPGLVRILSNVYETSWVNPCQ